MSRPVSSNASKVAANSFWYGIEMAFEIVTALATSMIMARTFGPEKLGYFNYVMWITNLSGTLGSLGLPMTSRKYMSEFFGQGRPDLARATFFFAFRRHLWLSVVITLAGLGIILAVADPEWRLASALQVASVLPSMIRFLPSQANMASENLRANVPGSIIGQSCFIAGVLLSIWLDWGLVGIAGGILAARTIECIVRTIPVLRWMKTLPDVPLPEEHARRIVKFARDSTFTLVVNIIVWDRSDMIFLERMVPQRAEISFFSVAFNLTEKMLLLPNTLAQATSVTLLAQFGRDRSQLPQIAAVTLKYLLLLSTPLLLGMAALSPAVVPLFYGDAFRPAAVALALAATLAIPRSLLSPGFNYLQAIERQRLLLYWNLVCACINIGLDLTLIPRWKAMGAVMASGIAQLFSVVGIWAIIISLDKVKVPWSAMFRILLAGGVMAAGVTLIVRRFTPALGIVLGIPAGAVLYLACIRMLGVLNAADRSRLRLIGQRLPVRMQPGWIKIVALTGGREMGA